MPTDARMAGLLWRGGAGQLTLAEHERQPDYPPTRCCAKSGATASSATTALALTLGHRFAGAMNAPGATGAPLFVLPVLLAQELLDEEASAASTWPIMSSIRSRLACILSLARGSAETDARHRARASHLTLPGKC
jgi:hypothetical protein